MFDPISHDPAGYQSFSYKDINLTAHNALALRAAIESMVLLKNQQQPKNQQQQHHHHLHHQQQQGEETGQIERTGSTGAGAALPLDFSAIKKLAVIGPLADDPPVIQGQLYGGKAPFVITPRAALANLTHVEYRNGSGVDDSNSSGFVAAVAAAASADATVLVLGITIRQASEGHDRDSVLLPQIQLDLAGNVSAAAAARGKPTIVGLVSGGGLDVSTLQSNPNISVRTERLLLFVLSISLWTTMSCPRQARDSH